MKLFRKYKIGLVLSGGAARGFAHLGVLKALEEKKMKPDIISGVSAGAIAGVFYADGYSPEEILEIFSTKKMYEIFRIGFPRTGFFKNTGIYSILKNNLRAKNIEDLQIPLIIAATNFNIGKVEYFDKGKLIDTILASSSIPLFFKVTEINNMSYIDGGILDNFPVVPIENKCKKLIGVHVNPLEKNCKPRGLAHIAERSLHLAIASKIQIYKELCDVFIEPERLIKYGVLSIRKGKAIFKIGYDEAIKLL